MILIHGLVSSPQEFGLLNHSLRMCGIRHHALTIPGYTLAYQSTKHRWRDWCQSATASMDEILNPNEPVILGGLCSGSLLAASLALKSSRPIAGLVMMSPTFKLDGWGLSAKRHLRHVGYLTGLDRFFTVDEREPYGIKNPKMRKRVAHELSSRGESAIGPGRVPLSALREAERMMRFVRGGLANLKCPLLMIHAREDEIASLNSVRKVFDPLPVKDKQLEVVDDSYHMITIDNDRHKVVALLEKFSHHVHHQHMTGSFNVVTNRLTATASNDRLEPLSAHHRRIA